MRIVSIAVRSFKGLENVELADLAPDLNLVVGPNESGKSRLVLALRYALFEKYKGESEDKKALRTYGSSDAPQVQVRFEARGATWTVRKQFLKQAMAKLEGGGRTWADEDAEAMLREILGTKAIQGRRDVDQFLGLWPLVWLRQGEATSAPQAHMNDDARARLRDVLAAQVNEVAAGPKGERIVARAEAERERYYTATGKETGELATARAHLAEAEAALEGAVAKRAEAHGAADELASVTRDLEGIDARMAAQRARVAEAAERATRAKDVAARLRAQEGDVARRRAEVELAERALAQHVEIAEGAARLEKRAAAEQAALEDAKRSQEELARRVEDAGARATAAGVALEAAHEAQLRARRRAHQDEAARREREAEERLARAKAHEARVVDLRAQLAQAGIDDAQIRGLRRASDALTKASAALAAASAGLRLRASRDLVIDGERLGEGEERAWTCDGPTRIVIEGVGVVDVRPGGSDLDARRVKEQEARHALARELERLGVPTVAEAEDRFARRTGLVAQLAHAEPLLAEAAPSGVLALEEDARARAAERAALGAPESDAPAGEVVDAAFAAASEAASRARAEQGALRAELARAEGEIGRAGESLTSLGRELAAAKARLAALPERAALDSALSAARGLWNGAQKAHASLADEHARTGDAELALEQEQRVQGRLESERGAKHARSVHLEAAVRIHGASDLHERVQRAEADVDERTQALRAVVARALAARELAAALHEARTETQRRLVAPVVERARPYLEQLLPGRRLRMDENWSVVGLAAESAEEDFHDLSGGAREQVSVVTRIALAEVLGADEPIPLVLDDAFVNTDRGRLGEMMRILYRASRKQQILVFSCHDEGFERLGETKRYELRRGG